MSTLFALIGWALFGLIAGAIARLLVPGRQSMSLMMTMLLGIAGSLTGGLVTWLITGGDAFQASGFVMSVVGAVLLLIAVHTQRKGHKAH